MAKSGTEVNDGTKELDNDNKNQMNDEDEFVEPPADDQENVIEEKFDNTNIVIQAPSQDNNNGNTRSRRVKIDTLGDKSPEGTSKITTPRRGNRKVKNEIEVSPQMVKEKTTRSRKGNKVASPKAN